MARHIVCLGFELVASTADDTTVGAARVLDLLTDRDLAATWFVTAAALARAGALVERLLRDGHEIALLARGAADASAVDAGLEEVRQITGTVPRGCRAPGGAPAVTGSWLAERGVRYDASGEGLSWWPRRRDDGTGGAGPGVVAMPIVLALGGMPLPSARAVTQDWCDELLQMRDAVNFGVLTCAMPLTVIARGAMLRAFTTFLDTATACGAVVLTFEAAAREAAERIGI
ncbi:polysaccharide deacetylase family protein [Rhodoplanes azumiensis]|uniref:Chitooligosaccharide deacetylase n=1 Tax=Rhodoplanes azumiensis TaxID=1897628 RepID=A0ABW5ASE1_9BRAD